LFSVLSSFLKSGYFSKPGILKGNNSKMYWYQRLSTKVALAVMISVGLLVIGLGFLAIGYTGSRLRQDAEEQRQAKVDLVRQELDTVDSLMQDQIGRE
jgi:hypothetical protein